MSASLLFQWAADVVLTVHVAVVMFVVGGLPLILIGNWRGWRWVNRLLFRLAHLTTIAYVAVQAWFGLECPLTTLERWLRHQGGAATYEQGFIEHWLQALLFWQAPAWVFTAVYSLFALAVATVWWWFPPSRVRADRLGA